ncbi:MAG TPA: histidine kinase [Candidatus Acidoferrum sp.]|nr:histidine kinase [Candidatus Acidoferrum sp.]
MDQFNLRKTLVLSLWMAWLVFAALLSTLMIYAWGMSWPSALALSLPLSALAQAVAWSARYSCRSNPIGRTGFGQLFLTHTTAALILSFLWVGVARVLAKWLAGGLGWSGTYQQLTKFQMQLYALGFAYYLLAVAFHYALIAQEASQEAQQRALESSVRARDAELSALKAQINPHFLYNSLNSISALTTIDPARAREMCVLLADFLRMTLGLGEKPLIPLGEELDLLDRYCAIEKVRFGERLQVQKNIDDGTITCLLPPLLLQPLFENAVVHGISQLPDGGFVSLEAHRLENRVSLVVENSWDPELVSARKKNGVGLKNVQRRLEARYGKDAHMDVRTEEHLFRISISIPAESAEAV